MVGRLMVEDEYTINVKLRRPLGEDGCLAPPTLTFNPDSPTITFTPPPETSFKELRATKSVNGKPCLTVCAHGIYPASRPGQLSIMAPGETCMVGTSPSPKVMVGRKPLPLIQVYSHDNDLVATNRFTSPRDRDPSPPRVPSGGQLALEYPSSSSGAGALFVPRIPAHCKSDSGVLYVPPVEERQLRLQQKEEPPLRGNSRRRRPLESENQLLPYSEREIASRVAARALLSNALAPHMNYPRPPSPRQPSTDLHLSRDLVSLSLDRPYALTWGDHSSDLEGDRVVEPYGDGVSTSHALGGGRGLQVNSAAEVPQPLDSATLTSIDLESDHLHTEMPTTNTPQHQNHQHHHDLNHNDHVFVHKPPEEGRAVGGRAAKYLVHDYPELEMGHDNYAFDSETSRQDIFGYDPGYSSEKSPEEEERPPMFHVGNLDSEAEEEEEEEEQQQQQQQSSTLRLHPGHSLTKEDLTKLLPFISEGTSFEVTIIKNLRGLGLAVCGGIESREPYPGLIRIKKLYPQTPAWICGQLEIGDILLHANGNPLTGLSSHEALEMLRTTEREVTLEVCRPPIGTFTVEDTTDGGSGIISTSLTLPSTSHNYLSPSPSFSSYGEFELTLTKVGGSLGFKLRKQDNSILGHTIRSLVREPAVSDGRIRPGDKIISVNNTNMCNLSHEEAIAYLRTCPETVTLKLYRDAMQTPVSPASPTEPDKVLKPKPLRKEARDMLTDLAMRKQSPGSSLNIAGSTSSPGTPRRRRLQKTPSPDIKSVVADRWDSLVKESGHISLGSPTLEKKISLNSIKETEHDASSLDGNQTDDSTSTTIRSRCSSATSSCSFTPSTSEARPKRPSFLDLNTGHGCPRKTQFTPPHEVDQSFPSPQDRHYPNGDSPDPAPPLTSAHSDTPAFSHLHQVYHSVNLGAQHPHEDLTMATAASHHNLSGLDSDGPTNQGLLKWKGVMFTPDSEEDASYTPHSPSGSPSSHKHKVVTIELNRGWNSRLGFSLQQQGDQTIITAIYADSVAAKDGRLRIGDMLVEVNSTSVVGWDCESVIDLLRKTSGKIFLSVRQQPC